MLPGNSANNSNRIHDQVVGAGATLALLARDWQESMRVPFIPTRITRMDQDPHRNSKESLPTQAGAVRPRSGTQCEIPCGRTCYRWAPLGPVCADSIPLVTTMVRPGGMSPV
jgi:hypothetical protein